MLVLQKLRCMLQMLTRDQKDARLVRKCTANILAVYLDAPDLTKEAGRRWYAEEGARCADFARRHGLTRAAVAGAAAAISPGLRWDTTFAHLAALRTNYNHKVPCYSRAFVLRALRILGGAEPLSVISGPKTTAFYKLLARVDMNAVVIDGHAWNVARNNGEVFRSRPDYSPKAGAEVTERRYKLAAQAYREAAEVLGEPAHSVQAATWIHWKNIFRPQGRQPGED